MNRISVRDTVKDQTGSWIVRRIRSRRVGLQPLKVTEEVVGLPLRKPSGEPSDGKTEANSNRNSLCDVRADRNGTGQERNSVVVKPESGKD